MPVKAFNYGSDALHGLDQNGRISYIRQIFDYDGLFGHDGCCKNAQRGIFGSTNLNFAH